MVHLPHLPEVTLGLAQVLHLQLSRVVVHEAFDLPQLLLVVLFPLALEALHLPPQHRVLLLQHLDLARVDILLVLAHLILH